MLYDKVAIGDIAYPAYRPQQAGVVVAILEPTPDRIHGAVVIEMPNGKQVTAVTVSSYQDLIMDHEAKLEAHLNKMAILKAFQAAKKSAKT